MGKNYNFSRLKFSIALKQDFQSLKDFIIPFEKTCANMASLIRKESENIYIISTCFGDESEILGCFQLNSTFVYCLPYLTDNEFLENFIKGILPILKNKESKIVHCISGEGDAAEILSSLFESLGQEITLKKDYFMMSLNNEANLAPENLSGDDMIIRCTEKDFDDLLELQRQFIEVEVNPGKEASNLEAGVMLKSILKSQICLAMLSDNIYVAKVNTNAIGINCVQIGGVYTHPLYRKNYYAWHLIHNLCLKAKKAGKLPVLFVNVKNYAAKNLYSKIGFTECGTYKIINLK